MKLFNKFETCPGEQHTHKLVLPRRCLSEIASETSNKLFAARELGGSGGIG